MSTIEQTIAGFIIDRKAQGLSPGTIKTYTYELGMFTRFLSPGLPIDELTPTMIREYLLHLQTTRNAGGCHIAYRIIRTLLYWWEVEIDNGYKAPIRKVKAPKINQEPLEPVTLRQVKALINTCMVDFFGIRDKAMILLLLDTGLRAKELLDINLDDVSLVQATILIRNGKGGKPRMVYFQPLTRRALRRYLNIHKGGIALFTDREGIRLTYSGIRQMLTRRSKYADIPLITCHMFRRAYALEMLRAGVDVFTLSRLMGHADERVLARYLKLVASDLEQAHRLNSPVDRL